MRQSHETNQTKTKHNKNEPLSIHPTFTTSKYQSARLYLVPVLQLGFGGFQLEVPRGVAKRHVLFADHVRSLEIVGDASRIRDTSVANEGENPSDERQRTPRDAIRIPVVRRVWCRQFDFGGGFRDGHFRLRLVL